MTSTDREFLFVFDPRQSNDGPETQGFPAHRIVKAQLGVHLAPGWLNLFGDPPDQAYAARIRNLEILTSFSRTLGERDFYNRFDIAGCRYGRYLFGTSWSGSERYLQFESLLEQFCSVHAPLSIHCIGLDAAPPIDARVFRTFCKARDISVVEIKSSGMAPPVAGDLWQGCVGAYVGQGHLGRERLFFRQDDPARLIAGKYPLNADNGGLKFDQTIAPAQCHFPLDAAAGAAALWRLRYVHLPDAALRLTLVADGKAASVQLDHRGWVTGEGPSAKVLGPAGPMYPGQGLIILDGQASFFFDAFPSITIPISPTHLPDGLHADAVGTDECYVYLDRLLLTEGPSKAALTLLETGPAPFLAKSAQMGAPSVPARRDYAALFHPTPAASPPVHGVPPKLAPNYQDGFEEFAGHGVSLHWISAQEPWRLDGHLHRSGNEHYLYQPIDLDFVALRKQWTDALDKDFTAVEGARDALLAQYPHPDFVDLFLANMKAMLPSVVSIAGEALRLRACLQEIKPDALIGARIDNAFPWAVAAARGLGIPTFSSEISFMYHEIHRMHRLSGKAEDTSIISVWGNEHLRRIDAVGGASETIRVGGLPALDFHKRCASATDMSRAEREALASYLGFPLRPGPVVLYGGWYGGRNPIYDADEFRQAIASIKRALGASGGGNIIIKSTPMDDPAYVREALAGLDLTGVHILHPRQPFHNAFYIALADVHVALPTTMLAESTAQGCPSIVLWTGTHSNWYPVSERLMDLLGRIMPVVRQHDELPDIVGQTIAKGHFSPPDDNAFADLFGTLGTDSTGRIAAMLEGLALQRPNAVRRLLGRIFARTTGK